MSRYIDKRTKEEYDIGDLIYLEDIQCFGTITKITETEDNLLLEGHLCFDENGDVAKGFFYRNASDIFPALGELNWRIHECTSIVNRLLKIKATFCS